MPDFSRVSKTSKWSIAVSVVSIVFIFFEQRLHSPLKVSCLATYLFITLIIAGSLITLCVNGNKILSPRQVIGTIALLELSTAYSVILTILFSVPAVRIFHCCLYKLDFLDGVTTDVEYECSDQRCSYNAFAIFLPLLSFIITALLTHQQVHNIYRYLHEKKLENESYDRLVHQIYPCDAQEDDVVDATQVEIAMA